VPVQVLVEACAERIEPLVHAGEPGLDAAFEGVELGVESCFQRVETSIQSAEPSFLWVESSVHPRAERIDPRAEVEKAAERRRSQEADRGPDGGFHGGERNTVRRSER
jgi:hypothetical protein